ncbi:hypothetical protein AOXY_G4607 [Acipenser oxyrinchus oxyrinchus]|uniref:ISXO2-like transposase domain-containing protein n=1 Tax=Acipenser oxyrinchus oxyrinchus TaxID=40147 RepID=A0AAD8GCZ4_ACIOX|nr:hypothetical protein AOXY_G4607 [Acipenser oxyrinchus oxyrinchus]
MIEDGIAGCSIRQYRSRKGQSWESTESLCSLMKVTSDTRGSTEKEDLQVHGREKTGYLACLVSQTKGINQFSGRDKASKHLVPLILHHAHPESTIISDEKHAYRGVLQIFGYNHYTEP